MTAVSRSYQSRGERPARDSISRIAAVSAGSSLGGTSLAELVRYAVVHLGASAIPCAWVGSPGASQPPAPTDPGVTVSRHRALLIGLGRADHAPVGEEAWLSGEQPGQPLAVALVG